MTTVDYTTNITAWVQAIQFQNPTQATINAFNAILNSDGLTPTPAQFATLSQQVVAQIEADPYTVNNVNPVIEIYQAAYGRVPDQAGLKFWVQAVAANPAAIATLATTFANAPEFAARYGAGVNATTPASPSLVISLYTNVLQRAPDANGLAFWESQNLNAAQLLQDFALSPEFVNDVSSLGNGQQPSYVQAFQTLEALGVPPTSGSLFNVTATNAFTLTTGADTFTAIGKGAVFTASPVQFAPLLGGTGILVNTLNTGDKLADPYNDGVLNDNIVGATLGGVFGAGFGTQPPFATGVSISGISTVNFNNQAATTSGQAPAGGVLGGFEGLGGISTSVTGITTVNNNNSIAPVQIGGVNAFGLGTVLQNYNSNNSDNNFAAFISAGAFGNTPATIAINLVGNMGSANTITKGTGKVAVVPENTPLSIVAGPATNVNGRVDFLTFAPDSGTAGYSTWTIASDYTNFLALGEGSVSPVASGIGTGVGSATSIVLSGKGSFELSSSSGVNTGGATGDWASLNTINASKVGGNVTITGGQVNAAGAYVNADGAEFGLLSGNNVIASILGGKGTNFVDLSSDTVNNAGEIINVAAGNTSTQNTLILSAPVVSQTTALVGESGYQIIGEGGQLQPGATVNSTITMANFPGANELKLYAAQTSGGFTETVLAPATFTLDLSGDTSSLPNAIGIAPVTGAFTFLPTDLGIAPVSWNVTSTSTTGIGTASLIMGSQQFVVDAPASPLAPAGNIASLTQAFDAIDALKFTGYNVANIAAGGPASASFTTGFDEISSITTVSVASQGITLNVSGGTSLAIIAPGAVGFGAITLGTDGGAIVDTDTGQFAFGVTNATSIAAGTSGGIFISGVDTATGGTNITGSQNAWNNIEGSNGNDVLNGGSAFNVVSREGDVIITNGGSGANVLTSTNGDQVNLALTHQSNHVDVYLGVASGALALSPAWTGALDYAGTLQPLNQPPVVAGQAPITGTSAATPNQEFAGAGFWGQTSGGAFDILAANNVGGGGVNPAFGTSASQVIISNFHAGAAPTADWVAFSVQEWSHLAGVTAGLEGVSPGGVASPSTVGTGAAVFSSPTAALGAVTGPAAADVIVLSNVYTGAVGLAQALASASGDITFNSNVAGVHAFHDLVVYTDAANPTTVHIADVSFSLVAAFGVFGVGTFASNNALVHVAVSDMVQLTGVSLGQITSGGIHFVA